MIRKTHSTQPRITEMWAKQLLQGVGYQCRWQGVYLLATMNGETHKLHCAGGMVDAAKVDTLLAVGA